jgi:hypothetical protein
VPLVARPFSRLWSASGKMAVYHNKGPGVMNIGNMANRDIDHEAESHDRPQVSTTRFPLLFIAEFFKQRITQ